MKDNLTGIYACNASKERPMDICVCMDTYLFTKFGLFVYNFEIILRVIYVCILRNYIKYYETRQVSQNHY